MSDTGGDPDQAAAVAPYVPRIAIDWAATADERWRTLDASLAFVDVSGFTALSERLAAQGRAGAEEITDLLGRFFADLLADAYAQGGSLLKFGGDALLLMFDGPDHAVRAATAAAAMRRTTRRLGNIKTSIGNVRLRTSAGVHTGEVHLFRVGESHRELIVTGPTASQVLEMEAAANAGQIVISVDTAAAIDPDLIGDPHPPGFALRDRVIRAADSSFPQAPVPPVDLTPAVPVALRPHILAGNIEPEHRHVAVAFVGFRLDTVALQAIGPDGAAEALHELVAQVQDAVDEHEVTFLGTDIDRDGGKIILVAGAPEARDDDSGRMLGALRRIAETARVLPVRIGVNRGAAFVGDIGPEYRRTYTVMGDAVNLAARLMAAAAEGEILATEEVITNSRRHYETTPRQPFAAKGKSELVRAFSVGPASRRELSPGSGANSIAPLVGRDREMDTLLWLQAEASTGLGKTVQITGAAGIGKSRLVQEFCRRSADVAVASASSEPYEQTTAWATFNRFLYAALDLDLLDFADGSPDEALRHLIADTAAECLPWAPLLANVLGVPMAPTPEIAGLESADARQRIFELIGALLNHRYPEVVVFVFEDIQWADEASLTAISWLAEHAAAGRAWLVVLTGRTELPVHSLPESSSHLLLEPLDEQASKQFIAAATARAPLRPHRRDALVRGAGGNPLFLEELLRAGVAGTDEALPDSVQGAVASTLDRLTVADRRLLRHAAVLGSEFDLHTFAEIAGEPVPPAEVLARRWAGLAEGAGPGRMRFSSEVVRNVAYETLPFRKRRDLHGMAGDAIEATARSGDTPAELLSLHFFHAGRYEKCWDYTLMAAKRAQMRDAVAEAVQLYERALSVARHLPDLDARLVGKARVSQADALHNAGEYERATSAYRQARQFLGSDVEAVAGLHLSEARIAQVQGKTTTAVRRLRRGIRALQSADTTASPLLAHLQVMQGWISHGRGKQKEAAAWAERALESAQRATTSGPPKTPLALLASVLDAAGVTAEAYLLLDLAELYRGGTGPWKYAARALPVFEELRDWNRVGLTLNALGVFAYYGGRWDEAAALYRRAKENYDRAGNQADATTAQYNAAEILLDQGHLDEAQTLLEEVSAVYRATGYQKGLGLTSRDLGRIAAQREDFGQAEQLLAGARETFSALGASGHVLDVDAWTADLLFRQGRRAQALSLLDEAEERAKGGGFATSLRLIDQIRSQALPGPAGSAS